MQHDIGHSMASKGCGVVWKGTSRTTATGSKEEKERDNNRAAAIDVEEENVRAVLATVAPRPPRTAGVGLTSIGVQILQI